MSFYLNLFLLPIFLNFQLAICTNPEFVAKFVTDFIEHEKIPIVLTMKDCWTKYQRISYLKMIPTSVQFISDVNSLPSVKNDYSNKMWFMVDMNCSDSVDFLKQVHDTYFAFPYHWILLNIKDDHRDFLDTLATMTDSDVVLAMFNEDTLQYQLEQIYKINKNMAKSVHEFFGQWNLRDGIQDNRPSRILSRRRRNLHGHLLGVSMVVTNNDTLNHLTDYRDPQVDSPTKGTILVIDRLIEALNATAKYIPEKTWGYADLKTGYTDGMVGHIIRGDVEIGGTVMFLTSNRVSEIEYVSMTTALRAAFVFRAPPLSYVLNVYYLPFTATVWICLIALSIVSMTIVYITYKFPKSTIVERNKQENVSDFFLLFCEILCQMGSYCIPTKPSGRMSFLFLLIAILFFYTSYTANIVALLQSTDKSINSLDTLSASTMEFRIQDTPYNRHYFPLVVESSRRKFYRTRLAPLGDAKFVNASYGISRMRQGMFAFFMELGSNYKFVGDTFNENEKCALMEIPYLEVEDPWCAIKKYSYYKEMLKVNVFKIREHGIQACEQNRLYTKRPICDSRGKTFGSVRLIDCYSAIKILFYGFVLSLAILIIENLMKYRDRLICNGIRMREN